MNESMTNELRTLRARAYGPDADLHDDPAGWQRLRELEDISRGQDVPLDESAPPPVVQEEALPSPVEEAPAPAASVESEDRPEDAPSRTGVLRGRWSGRRAAIVLVAAVATAVVVTATVTGVISRRMQADPREVAILGVDPAATVPQIFGNWVCENDECTTEEEVVGTVFTEFYGLSASTIPGHLMGDDDATACLVVLETSQLDAEPGSFRGRMYFGCGAGEFPATAEIAVTDELPEELRDEFPEGSALQFVLDGDEVVVLSDAR